MKRPTPIPATRSALGSIRADEVIPLPVFRSRMGLGNRGVAEARRRGLRIVRFGHFGYVLGKDALAFFDGLAAAGEQAEGGPAS